MGPEKYRYGKAEETDQIGAATGLLGQRPVGILDHRSMVFPGKGKLTLTGKLGDVMKNQPRLHLAISVPGQKNGKSIPSFHEKNDIHIHVPEGAIPKDGPSAGITMATALISALTGVPVSREVGMTGEITLRGRVLPIGGLKEKVLGRPSGGIDPDSDS